jgi:transketolase
MRKTLFEAIKLQMENQDTWLLIGDVGWGFIEAIEKKFPDRFINCGIAEQNMIGVAAGLALSGKRVYVFSIANFVTFRCFEQVRNCLAYENLPVTIIGVGGKNAYPGYGISHNCPEDEDIKIMGTIPVEVCVPKTKKEVRELIEQIPKKTRYIRVKR